MQDYWNERYRYWNKICSYWNKWNMQLLKWNKFRARFSCHFGYEVSGQKFRNKLASSSSKGLNTCSLISFLSSVRFLTKFSIVDTFPFWLAPRVVFCSCFFGAPCSGYGLEFAIINDLPSLIQSFSVWPV